MSAENVQLATTEAIFRSVNERIAEGAQRFDVDDDVEFVCECSDRACTHRVPASLDEYEHVREKPERFLLVPGHEDERIERVVEHRRRFAIVEKFEKTVVATVRRFDPRAV